MAKSIDKDRMEAVLAGLLRTLRRFDKAAEIGIPWHEGIRNPKAVEGWTFNAETMHYLPPKVSLF